jgi:hypothetical protein
LINGAKPAPAGTPPAEAGSSERALRCRDALAFHDSPQCNLRAAMSTLMTRLRDGSPPAAGHRDPAGVAACDRRNCRGVADLLGGLRSDPFNRRGPKRISRCNRLLVAAIFTTVSASMPYAAMNGIALHGGFIPMAAFLSFADYSRPAIRWRR